MRFVVAAQLPVAFRAKSQMPHANVVCQAQSCPSRQSLKHPLLRDIFSRTLIYGENA